jgi:hypothetical protein
MSIKSFVFSLLPLSTQRRIILQKTGQKVISNAALTPTITLDVVIPPKGNTWVNRLAKPYGHEPEVVKWFERNLKNDDVVFDVGAHFGFYGILATQLCPQVKFYGFEGNWFTISFQESNRLKSPQPNNWFPINKMVGDHANKDFVMIDQYINDGIVPTVFQMDVDGEEVNVFNGAKSLIALAKTTFIIEVHPKDLKERGQNIDQVLNFFSDEKFKKAYLPNLRKLDTQWTAELSAEERTEEFYFLATPIDQPRM